MSTQLVKYGKCRIRSPGIGIPGPGQEMSDFQLKFDRKMINSKPAGQTWKYKLPGTEFDIPCLEQEMIAFQLEFNKKVAYFKPAGQIGGKYKPLRPETSIPGPGQERSIFNWTHPSQWNLMKEPPYVLILTRNF